MSSRARMKRHTSRVRSQLSRKEVKGVCVEGTNVWPEDNNNDVAVQLHSERVTQCSRANLLFSDVILQLDGFVEVSPWKYDAGLVDGCVWMCISPTSTRTHTYTQETNSCLPHAFCADKGLLISPRSFVCHHDFLNRQRGHNVFLPIVASCIQCNKLIQRCTGT